MSDGADLISTRTSLMKLAIIIENTKLHSEFLLNDGLAFLVGLLHKTLLAGDEEAHLSILFSIVKCLLHTAYYNPRVVEDLANDTNFLLNLLR